MLAVAGRDYSFTFGNTVAALMIYFKFAPCLMQVAIQLWWKFLQVLFLLTTFLYYRYLCAHYENMDNSPPFNPFS